MATRVNQGGNAGTYFTHGDHLGSLNVLTNSSGVEVQRLTYLPYGETHTNQGSVDFHQYRYTGQEQDSETGLYFYQARYYNPVLGRFLSPDSLVPDPSNPQSLNRYSYVLNNPLTLVDPSGLLEELPTDLGVPFFGFPSIPLYLENRPPDTDAGLPPGVEDVDIRAWAAARLLIRAGEIGGGLVVGGLAGWTGIGAIGAVGIVGHGILGASADIETLVFGEPTSSVPSQILQRMGVPQPSADALDVGVSGVATLVGATALLPGAAVAGTGAAISVGTNPQAGNTVIGHFPEYLRVAEQLGGRVFNIPPAIWERMSASERWAASQRFLDRAIARGDQIRLATPIRDVVVGSSYWNELQYLFDRGFKVDPTGTRLLR